MSLLNLCVNRGTAELRDAERAGKPTGTLREAAGLCQRHLPGCRPFAIYQKVEHFSPAKSARPS